MSTRATSGTGTKMTALNSAISRASDADIVILYDSDCFLPPADLRQLVALAQEPSQWGIPCRTVRLKRSATRRVLADQQIPALSAVDYSLIHPFQENHFTELPIPIVDPL